MLDDFFMRLEFRLFLAFISAFLICRLLCILLLRKVKRDKDVTDGVIVIRKGQNERVDSL